MKASTGFPGPAISHGRSMELKERFCRCLVSFNWERKKEVKREMCFLGLQLAGVLLSYRHQSLKAVIAVRAGNGSAGFLR